MGVETWTASRARCDLCGWVGPIRHDGGPLAALSDLDDHERGRGYCPEENLLIPDGRELGAPGAEKGTDRG